MCHRIAVFDFGETSCSNSSDALTDNDRGTWTEASESCSELNVDITTPLRVQNIVSQSDMLRLLERNKDHFSDVLSASVSDLGLADKPVVCVPSDMTAVHAFASMFAFNVTSVGVVDHRQGGILVANLSASDLRGIKPKDFPVLSSPVLSFLRQKQALSNGRTRNGTFLQGWGMCGGKRSPSFLS